MDGVHAVSSFVIRSRVPWNMAVPPDTVASSSSGDTLLKDGLLSTSRLLSSCSLRPWGVGLSRALLRFVVRAVGFVVGVVVNVRCACSEITFFVTFLFVCKWSYPQQSPCALFDIFFSSLLPSSRFLTRRREMVSPLRQRALACPSVQFLSEVCEGRPRAFDALVNLDLDGAFEGDDELTKICYLFFC